MNSNDPAFPRPIGWNGLTNRDEHDASSEALGMTLRVHIATQVLVGIVAGNCIGIESDCNQAVAYADQLIKELNRGVK